MTVFLNCNRAIVEAAIQAGCRFFAGYPFTPATECLEQASHRLPAAGGVYVQAESEVSVINMLMGAATAGFRCMTATSGAGFALWSREFGDGFVEHGVQQVAQAGERELGLRRRSSSRQNSHGARLGSFEAF